MPDAPGRPDEPLFHSRLKVNAFHLRRLLLPRPAFSLLCHLSSCSFVLPIRKRAIRLLNDPQQAFYERTLPLFRLSRYVKRKPGSCFHTPPCTAFP